MIHPVVRENWDVRGGGCHARHPHLLDGFAVLGPPAVQDDGFRGHAVGVDATLHVDFGCDTAGH